MKTVGAVQYKAKLGQLTSPAQLNRVSRALFKGGQLIEVTAEKLITSGSVSGKRHVASLPGEPPNRDTGVLDNNIETTQPAKLKVIVSSNAPYSAFLELGTSKLKPRPFMKPASDLKRDEVLGYINTVIENAIKEK